MYVPQQQPVIVQQQPVVDPYANQQYETMYNNGQQYSVFNYNGVQTYMEYALFMSLMNQGGFGYVNNYYSSNPAYYSSHRYNTSYHWTSRGRSNVGAYMRANKVSYRPSGSTTTTNSNNPYRRNVQSTQTQQSANPYARRQQQSATPQQSANPYRRNVTQTQTQAPRVNPYTRSGGSSSSGSTRSSSGGGRSGRR